MQCVKERRVLLGCPHNREVPSVAHLPPILTKVGVAFDLKAKILYQRALLLLRGFSLALVLNLVD